MIFTFRIKDRTKIWKENDEKNQVILKQFATLFFKSGAMHNTNFLESLLGRVTEELKADLAGTFTREEVKVALNQMSPLKALRPYGMALVFF